MTFRHARRCSALLAVAACAVLALALPTPSPAAGRITNGEKVAPGAFAERWGSIVSLQAHGALAGPYDSTRHVCGGVLVDATHVLTAAHCVVDAFGSVRRPSGMLDVLTSTRVLKPRGLTRANRIPVLEVFVHPSYTAGALPGVQGGAPDLRSDIAVLLLSRPAAAPATALVDPSEDAIWGSGAGLKDGAWIAGWGLTATDRSDAYDRPDGVLRETSIPLHSDAFCESTDSTVAQDAPSFDRSTMLCGGTAAALVKGSSTRRGSCNGDSGSPMLAKAADGSWRVVGVTSWGPSFRGGCNAASVYSRVAGLRDWIRAAVARPAGTGPAAPAAATAVALDQDTLRISWASTEAGIARFRIYRETSYQELFGITRAQLAKLPRAMRVVLRTSIISVAASAGPEARALNIHDVRPQRRGGHQLRRVRIEALGVEGTSRLSPPILVAAPVDSQPPRPPGIPRLLRPDEVPLLVWGRSSDDDCVERYAAQIRAAGSFRWRTVAHVEGSCGDEFVEGSRDPFAPIAHSADVRHQIGTDAVGQSVRGIAAGRYVARVLASDRAGNTSSSKLARMTIRQRLPAEGCTTWIESDEDGVYTDVDCEEAGDYYDSTDGEEWRRLAARRRFG